jgi:hypothetical protein
VNTTRNLAKVFATALRGAAQDLRAEVVLPPEDGEGEIRCRHALESIEAVADELAAFAARPDPDGGTS